MDRLVLIRRQQPYQPRVFRAAAADGQKGAAVAGGIRLYDHAD